MENLITGNLEWTIKEFSKTNKGYLTFPTKFDMVDSICNIKHSGRIIVRMSVNPEKIINQIEIGTSKLADRVKAINKLKIAGYKIGILIAPVIMIDNWKEEYENLIKYLHETLSLEVKQEVFFEVIFMTYSYVHRMINQEAFPNAINLYNKELMTGRGRGKYMYKSAIKQEGEEFFRKTLNKYFPNNKIIYIV